MRIYRPLIILIFLLLYHFSKAQDGIHSIEKATELQKIDQKNRIIFIHTDWCNYCEAMLHKTFKNNEITELLKQNFHFSTLNAEEKRNIDYAERIWKYQPSGPNIGIHQLALSLGTINHSITYPTLVIINSKGEIIFQYAGFLNAKDLRNILQQFQNE